MRLMKKTEEVSEVETAEQQQLDEVPLEFAEAVEEILEESATTAEITAEPVEEVLPDVPLDLEAEAPVEVAVDAFGA